MVARITAVDHAMNHRNVGRQRWQMDAQESQDLAVTPWKHLRISREKIVDARFWIDGCGSSIACGSVITEFVKGRHISEVEQIDSRFVLDALDGLPDSGIHCSVLASNTLKAAIRSHTLRFYEMRS